MKPLLKSPVLVNGGNRYSWRDDATPVLKEKPCTYNKKKWRRQLLSNHGHHGEQGITARIFFREWLKIEN